MVFKETQLKGAFVIELEKIADNRGFFARAWCQKEFQIHGLDLKIVQCNLTFSKKKGTLRGLHYQVEPHEEAKVVCCTRGKIYDKPKNPKNFDSKRLNYLLITQGLSVVNKLFFSHKDFIR